MTRSAGNTCTLNEDTIFIEGLELYAYHGVPEAEREIGHRYRIDARLRLDLREAGKTDSIRSTVDYASVAQTIVETATKERFLLVEALAETLCNRLLEGFPTVQEVTLTVRKVLPPFPCVVASVGVEITRRRT